MHLSPYFTPRRPPGSCTTSYAHLSLDMMDEYRCHTLETSPMSRRVLFCTLLLLVATVLWMLRVLLQVDSPQTPLRPTVPVHEYTYAGNDNPSRLLVDLASTQHVMNSSAPRFSLHADDDWASLFPASDGFVDLHSSSPGSSSEPHARTFLVSVVHQLHCLDVFRVGFATNRSGYAHHVEHCLRYMLQIVLCQADTTLEVDEPGVRNGKWVHAAGGVGSVRECKDWKALWRYLDEHAAGPVRVDDMMERMS